MRIPTQLQDYFYFTRTEKNGALGLCLLSIALFLSPFILKPGAKQQVNPDFQARFVHFTEVENRPEQVNTKTILFYFNPNTIKQEEMLDLGLSPKLAQTIVNFRNKGGQFRRKEDLLKIYGMQEVDYQRLEPYITMNSAEVATANNGYPRERNKALSFPFDPNTATKDDLIKLGLPEKTVATVLKFRDKGGTFRRKEDLKKIYGLKDKDYERLAPYITFSETPQPEQPKPILVNVITPSPDSKKPAAPTAKIDINQAAPEAWQTLRGIGPAYAKRIVNFREKLGGFYSIEQVKETYGLPDSTFQAIQPHLIVSPVLRKIAINTATVDELKAHPYIDARQAAAIVSYREQHGSYRRSEDLKLLKALPAHWLEKISPYLQFD